MSYWFYESLSDGPHACTKRQSKNEWAMLPAYRAGGIEGVHWKYVDDGDVSWCMPYTWRYYSSDGETLIATISTITTTLNDSRPWCAMPVYRPGGVAGKQWTHCICRPLRAL